MPSTRTGTTPRLNAMARLEYAKVRYQATYDGLDIGGGRCLKGQHFLYECLSCVNQLPLLYIDMPKVTQMKYIRVHPNPEHVRRGRYW